MPIFGGAIGATECSQSGARRSIGETSKQPTAYENIIIFQYITKLFIEQTHQ